MSLDDLTELDQEQLNDERLRRMKVLMRQLYRDEFEAKTYKLPPIKGRTLILVVSFISVIVFGVTTLYNYNRFVTLEEHILSAEGHVETASQYRANLFSNLFNLALNHADVEREVFHFVAESRAHIKGVVDRVSGQPGVGSAASASVSPQSGSGPSGVEAAGQGLHQGLHAAAGLGLQDMAGLSDSVARLLAIVERYPDIKSSATYLQLMEQLVTLEERVVTRRDETNEAIRVYNTLISTFPWYVLAKATGFARHQYYRFSINDTLLSADVFERLLPDPARLRLPALIPAPLEPTSLEPTSLELPRNVGMSSGSGGEAGP